MDEERQKKLRQMKIGVILAMVLILIFWSFNLSNVWRLDNERSAPASQPDWGQVKADFGRTVTDLKNHLDQISTAQKAAEASTSRAFVTDLIKNTEKLSSSTVATSSVSASSTTTTSATASSTETASSTSINVSNKSKK